MTNDAITAACEVFGGELVLRIRSQPGGEHWLKVAAMAYCQGVSDAGESERLATYRRDLLMREFSTNRED